MVEQNKENIEISETDTPKKLECEVCGSKIAPRIKNKHICKENEVTGGMSNALKGIAKEPRLYDYFDCPVCGCQIVAKERLREVE